MARWWKEQYNPDNPKHPDQMWGAGWPYEGIAHSLETTPVTGGNLPSRYALRVAHTFETTPHLKLAPAWVYFVSVCSFTFTFRSLDQIRACLEFYNRKVLDGSRIDKGAADHWEVQTWYQRLPLYLREEPKRQKVIKALSRALAEFGQ